MVLESDGQQPAPAACARDVVPSGLLWKKSAAAGCGGRQTRKPSARSGMPKVENGYELLFPTTFKEFGEVRCR